MNYFQCTEKVDGYPLDCKFTFKRLETFVTVTCIQMGFMHRKNDRNQIDVPWHFPISRCFSILIFCVLFNFDLKDEERRWPSAWLLDVRKLQEVHFHNIKVDDIILMN